MTKDGCVSEVVIGKMPLTPEGDLTIDKKIVEEYFGQSARMPLGTLREIQSQ